MSISKLESDVVCVKVFEVNFGDILLGQRFRFNDFTFAYDFEFRHIREKEKGDSFELNAPLMGTIIILIRRLLQLKEFGR